MYHANGSEKKARVAILLLDEINFKTKTVNRREKRTLCNNKWKIQQENVTIVSMHPTREHPNM